MTPEWLAELGVTLPVLAAPMAGGPTTPALVAAAAEVGSLGFVPAGYRSAADTAALIADVRVRTPRFGVNVFVPQPVPCVPGEYRAYATAIAAEGERYGLDLTAAPLREDDDDWHAKVDLLVADPVPVVSFTFGLPEQSVIDRLQRAGTRVVQTITSADEAGQAAAAGVDALVVQACAAGGHSGTFTGQRAPVDVPLDRLLSNVRQVSTLPLVAAGGLSDPSAVAAVIRSGAAVLVGTALLLADEAGTSATNRTALLAAADGADATVVTRAFTGRYARGLRNAFTERYDPIAPAGYPALHHLTSPLRKAAAAAGDSDRLHLWAGTGHRRCAARPAKAILTGLAELL